MPLIKEIEDALKLVEQLPEMDQRHAAMYLRRVVMSHEERMTMNELEREALQDLKRRDFRKKIDQVFGPTGKMTKALGAVRKKKPR